MRTGHTPLILLSGGMSGSTFLFLKVSVEYFPAPFIALARMGLGGVVLLLTFRTMRGYWPKPPANLGDLFFVTIFGSVLLFPLQAWGTSYVPSGTAALIFATLPVITAVITTVLGSDRRCHTRYLVPSLALGLVGVGVLVGPQAVISGHNYLLGATILLAAATCTSVSAVHLGRNMANEDALSLAAYQMSLAFLFLVPLGLISYAVHPTAGESAAMIEAVAAILGLGIINSGINYFVYTHLIVEAGPTAATYVTFVTPPIAVLLGAVVLAEPLDWQVPVSMVLIAGCLLLLTRSYERPRPAG